VRDQAMRLLVTGGAGRLGSEVVRLAASRGHSVVAFDLPQVYWGSVDGIEGIEKLLGDITDAGVVRDAVEGVDGVVHLAGLLPPRSEVDRVLTMRVNVDGTRNIVEALRGLPNVPLVFASSISTYGITADEEFPIGEDNAQRAHNNYSESKIEAERLIKESGVPNTILRIAPISVADLVELPDVIPYRADQRVEFVYVEDAAQAILSSLENPAARGKVLNIAGGRSWQMTGQEYVEGFYSALGVDLESVFLDDYTAVDWYDTSRSLFLDYQRLSFNGLLERLRVLGEWLGLR
jgi:nucleoside-diphosphate-sugar epimerase